MYVYIFNFYEVWKFDEWLLSKPVERFFAVFRVIGKSYLGLQNVNMRLSTIKRACPKVVENYFFKNVVWIRISKKKRYKV